MVVLNYITTNSSIANNMLLIICSYSMLVFQNKEYRYSMVKALFVIRNKTAFRCFIKLLTIEHQKPLLFFLEMKTTISFLAHCYRRLLTQWGGGVREGSDQVLPLKLYREHIELCSFDVSLL